MIFSRETDDSERCRNHMLKRTLSAFIAIGLLFAVLWADIATNLPIVEIALGLLMLASLYEIYKPFGFIKRALLAVMGFALGTVLYITGPESGVDLKFILTLFIMVMFILAVTYHRTVKFSDISILLFATLYISMGMLHIRLLYNGTLGFTMLFMALISAFLTDTGAYFSGYFFGKHKLIPEISPKKTVEGAIGGVVIAIVSLLIYALILTFFGIKTNLLNIIIIGAVASVGSQFGDLSASMIKRELGIKDYGEIMPGHGGVLDRFDSLLFVAPIIYYLNIILPIFSK